MFQLAHGSETLRNMALLDVTAAKTDGGVVITATGELDVSTAPLLEQELERATREGASTIRLDLSALRFMDSTGLGLVISADGKARDAGHRLELVPGPDNIQRVFEVAGLDKRLSFVPPNDPRA